MSPASHRKEIGYFRIQDLVQALDSTDTLSFNQWRSIAELLLARMETRRLTANQLAKVLQETDFKHMEITRLGKLADIPTNSVHRLIKQHLLRFNLFNTDAFGHVKLRRKNLVTVLRDVSSSSVRTNYRDPESEQTILKLRILNEELKQQLEEKVPPLPINIGLWLFAHVPFQSNEVLTKQQSTNFVVSAAVWLARNESIRSKYNFDVPFNKWTHDERYVALAHFFQMLIVFKRWDLIAAFTADLIADPDDEGVGDWESYIMKP